MTPTKTPRKAAPLTPERLALKLQIARAERDLHARHVAEAEAEIIKLGGQPTAGEGRVIMPLGWLAGQPVALAVAVQNLSSEILGHAADLEERQEKNSAVGVKTLASQAYDLRRYGWALWLIQWQTLTPEEKAAAVVDLGSLAELAERYNLALPEDLKT